MRLKNIKIQTKGEGAKKSTEEVAHKVAWAAVKKEYTKENDKWVKKDE